MTFCTDKHRLTCRRMRHAALEVAKAWLQLSLAAQHGRTEVRWMMNE